LGGTSSSPQVATTSSSSQITSSELKAKSVPYLLLRHSADTLLIRIDNVRRFIENDEFVVLAYSEFREAYGHTFFKDMLPWYVSDLSDVTCFEKEDCPAFNEDITTIEYELKNIENPIRSLRKSDPNVVRPIQQSLDKVTENGRDIIVRVDRRLKPWGL